MAYRLIHMTRPRVIVADDAASMVSTVSTLLRESFEVVRTAFDGREALQATLALEPDLVVLDVSMPVMSGIEVAQKLAERGSKAKIVFLTVHEDTDIMEKCRDAGGLGYVIKILVDTDLVLAMNEALSGRMFVSHFHS
jgi:DNA-binding NarL/FixJ family response regulator